MVLFLSGEVVELQREIEEIVVVHPNRFLLSRHRKKINENIASDRQRNAHLGGFDRGCSLPVSCKIGLKCDFMATRLLRRKSSLQCTGNMAAINSVRFARPVLCIIHVMHKELRTMTVRNDSERDVGMGFFFFIF